MNPAPTIERFIAIGYAVDALKFSRFDCDELEKLPDTTGVEWLSRVTALVTHYARPFKRGKGIAPLRAELVPTEFRDLHSKLIEARDKAHAHLDGDLSFVGTSSVHRLYLLKESASEHHWISTRAILVERRDLPEIRRLIESLLAALDAESDVIEKQLLPLVGKLSQGLYQLSPIPPHFQIDEDHGHVASIRALKIIN